MPASFQDPRPMLFPLTPEEDAARLPVAVLTGFLGSGKTTLVNRLLRDPRMAGTAVAVNEFGEVPIDGRLIGHGAERTVVLANGCLCCTLSGEMEEAVMRLFARADAGAVPGFRRLLVEPSGLADPGPIAQAVLRQPALSRVLRLEGIVAVVDAQFGERQLAEHPEARAQVELADLCVVTKGDLADTAGVRAALGRVHADLPVLEARHGEVDAAALFPEAFLEPERPIRPSGDRRAWRNGRAARGGDGAQDGAQDGARDGARDGASGELRGEAHGHGHRAQGHHAHGHRVHGAVSVSLEAGVPLLWEPFERWLRAVRLAPGGALLRVKGILDVRGRARPVVVQGVRHVLHPPAELEAWPAGGRRSCLVLIGRGGADWAEAMERGWREALPGMTGDGA